MAIGLGLKALALTMAIWCFALLRVASEGLSLAVGSAEQLYEIGDRATAAWVQANQLHIRFKKRKNRPEGSLVRVPCYCRSCRFCPVHLFPELLQQPDRTMIWSLPPHQALKEIKRIAELVGLANANKLSWKSWRAGRATAMANAGHGVASILCAGDWRSSAFARYVDEECIDGTAMLATAIDQSDED